MLAAVVADSGDNAAQTSPVGWRIERVPTEAPAVRLIRTENGAFLIEGAHGTYRRIVLTDGRVSLADVDAPAPAAASDDMLPDGRIARRGEVEAWFADPTGRYGHAILGDAVEAESLAVRHKGLVVRYTLGPSAVFEDIEPRFGDLDGDGTPEILAIKSYLDRGAALAAFVVGSGEIRPLAETPPIGLAHRWLNPVGVADFDGDGRPEAALVATPHIGGILRFYRLEKGGFHMLAELPGFSNHSIGSRVLDQAAIGDFDGDGVADIALPDQARRALRFVRFAGGVPHVFATADIAQRIDGEIYAADLDGDGRLEIALRSGGRIYLLLRR